MKKTLFTLIALVLFVTGNILSAQSVDEVIASHLKAVGQEKLSTVKTISMGAKIMQQGMELPMSLKIKRPNKFRMEMDMQGQKMIQAYNGTTAWMIAPWLSPDPQDLTGDQLKQAKDQADIDGQLANYKEKGHSAELIGVEDMDGSEVYNIKLTKAEGDVQNYYIDKETLMIIKAKSIVNQMGQEIEVETILGDYKSFNGIVMPMSMESKTPMGSANIVFENVKFDEPIDDSIFVRPTK